MTHTPILFYSNRRKKKYWNIFRSILTIEHFIHFLSVFLFYLIYRFTAENAFQLVLSVDERLHSAITIDLECALFQTNIHSLCSFALIFDKVILPYIISIVVYIIDANTKQSVFNRAINRKKIVAAEILVSWEYWEINRRKKIIKREKKGDRHYWGELLKEC